MTETKACPICGEPAREPAQRPFCSARCRQIDLNRWLGEVYRVPTAPGDANGEEHDDEQEE
jgi:endogenous inhibitor of DNA gyrase (YacG/DUF329 family)